MASPTDKPTFSRNKKLSKLWAYFAPYSTWFAIGSVFLILTNVLKLAIPRYIGNAVDMMEKNAGSMSDFMSVRGDLIDAALIIIALAIGAGVVRVFSRIFIFNAGRYIEYDIRNDFYAKLASLTPAFFDTTDTGDLTSRAANDIKQVRLLYAVVFLHIVNTTVAFAIALTRMVQLDWELTLACLLPYPVFFIGLRYIVAALYRQTKVVQAQLSDLSSNVQENLNGAHIVKSFAIEDEEKDRFRRLNQSFFEKVMTQATLRGGLQSLMAMVAGTGTLIVLAIGSKKVVSGQMPLGTFVEFNGYVVALAFPTIAMGWVFSIWHRGLASFDRLLEILETEPTLTDPAPEEANSLPARTSRRAVGRIEFDGVSFTYPEATEQVLHDIDLEIPAGSTVGIVGPTGAGKSTLVDLLARFYEPTKGQIRLDETPIESLPLAELRRQIGLVPQEPFLFSMTIRQNIQFGVDGADRERLETDQPPRQTIREVASLAGLDRDLDRFSDGLDTLVGERGVTLSGGQKQRITIARALLKDPRILILDDALSSVDTETENLILQHLEETFARQTTVILTHRFNILEEVDTIFVFDEGQLVEQGDHRQLLEQRGLYWEMVKQQQLEREASE